MFQYNFCYCSIWNVRNCWFSSKVSIQLLLLFYLRLRKCRSVHMGFNTTFVTVLLVVVSSALLKAAFQYNFCYCSIWRKDLHFWTNEEFQYNFCYCSISPVSGGWQPSLVSIQLLLLFYFIYRFSKIFWTLVTIQLLLLFYQDTRQSIEEFKQFQYNFCYCSMMLQGICRLFSQGFNTTFVTVL